MTLREKINLLKRSYESQEDFEKVEEKIPIINVDDRGLAYIHFDLRLYIRRTLKAEKVKQKEIAEILNIHPKTFSNYLVGERGIPYEKLEQLLGLLYFSSRNHLGHYMREKIEEDKEE